MLGNKGGIKISFKIGKTRICCICCHLAAGQNGVERRNVDWKKIERKLVLNLKEKENEKAINKVGVAPDESQNEIYDAVIWLGDFNYRINGVIGAISFAMEKNMYEVLRFND